jgi:hypothetical protein
MEMSFAGFVLRPQPEDFLLPFGGNAGHLVPLPLLRLPLTLLLPPLGLLFLPLALLLLPLGVLSDAFVQRAQKFFIASDQLFVGFVQSEPQVALALGGRLPLFQKRRQVGVGRGQLLAKPADVIKCDGIGFRQFQRTR